MQVATSTLLILQGLLPGVAFLSAYFSGKFPRQLAALSPLGELALYVVWALPIDALALRVLSHPCGPVPVAAIIYALRGDPIQPGPSLYAVFEGYGWWKVFIAYSGVILGAGGMGLLARRVVWAFRLDVTWPFLRLSHDWFYLLQGRLPGLPRRLIPQADVLVTHPGEEGTRLYAGVISGFEVNRAGEIENLVLVAAHRYRRGGQGPPVKSIPGERFILVGATIHSINLRYYQVQPPKDRVARFRYRAMGAFRSFWFEEP